MADKLPAFQFYPGDWMKSPDVRICSLPARGLLMDLLCLCHESAIRGCLVLPSGVPISDEQLYLAIPSGVAYETFKKWLDEVIDNGALSRHESGYIFSRRIVREENLRRSRAEAGAKGAESRWQNDGKGDGKPLANGMAKPMAKHGSSSSSSSSNTNTKPPNPLAGGRSPAAKAVLKIRKRDMENLQRLDAWILKNLPPPHSENLRIKVLACAICSMRDANRNPSRMFLAMLEKGMAGEWTVPDEDIQAASRQIVKHKSERRNEPEHIGEILRGRNGT